MNGAHGNNAGMSKLVSVPDTAVHAVAPQIVHFICTSLSGSCSSISQQVARLMSCFTVLISRHVSLCPYDMCLLVQGGTITLADGQKLQYDWLVLSLGSSTSFFGIPGVKDHALPFNDFKDAMRVCCNQVSLPMLLYTAASHNHDCVSRHAWQPP